MQDSRSVSVLHHGDVRTGIPERYKHQANCSMPRIEPSEVGISNRCIGPSRDHMLMFGTASSGVAVTYAAQGMSGPVVLNARLLPFDTNAMKLLRGQEVASPVLDLKHTPGTVFNSSLVVHLPVEIAKAEWFQAYEAKHKLAAISGTRRADAWDYLEASEDLMMGRLSALDGSSSRSSLSTFGNKSRNMLLSTRLGRRTLLQVDEVATVEMVAVWYNNETQSWTPLSSGSISEV